MAVKPLRSSLPEENGSAFAKLLAIIQSQLRTSCECSRIGRIGADVSLEDNCTVGDHQVQLSRCEGHEGG